MKKILAGFLLIPLFASPQASTNDSLWLPISYFVGEWTGKSIGRPGEGVYERTYRWVLNKRFVEIKNKSTYPPNSANKNTGEVHEDIGYFSYDRGKKCFILRQFHIESFVIHYKLDSISPDKKTVVFISEQILENLPAGFRTRETYKVINEKEFMEVFEIAEPNKDFEVYSEAVLKRKN